MICLHCAHDNHPSARFCEECGQRLAFQCPRCGELVRPEAKFCSSCGEWLAGETAVQMAIETGYF